MRQEKPVCLVWQNALVSYDPVYEGLVAQLLGRTLVVDTIDHAIVIQRKYRQTPAW